MLEELLRPGKIGDLELSNRVIMTAMHLNHTPGGKVSERIKAFYEERARYGLAMAIVGGCTVDEYAGSPDMLSLKEDADMEGLKGLTDAVHRAGGLICAQLYHAGGYAHSFFLGGKQALSPSGVPSRFTKETPREMTRSEILWVIENFAKAAARAKEAGFDAVEILASAGYLISQFLSPLTNKREDEYGGPLENRMRFGLEVLRGVRSAVGRRYPVICRIAGNDFVPGSHTNEEARLFAMALDQEGVEAINVTGGWHETRVPQLLMSIPYGTFTYLARGVREVVRAPVIACNRINDPRTAEEVLRQGCGDFVGMARAFLADPQVILKVKERRLEEIVHCIGCAQACFDHVFMMRPVSCLMNPRAGREFEIREERAPRPKKIWVVGGGPGGMMAAATAARRGHDVTLFEQEDRLGGQLRLAGAPYMRRDFRQAAVDLETQLRTAGVKVRCGQKLDRGRIRRGKPEAVILATGAKPLFPDIPGVHSPHVVTAWDVLARKANAGRDVVIIGGGAVGCETALHLCESGTISAEAFRFLAFQKAESWEVLERLITRGWRKVTIVEMLDRIGQDIGISTRWAMVQDLHRFGVRVLTGAKAKQIEADGVVVVRGEKEEKIRCDTVVLAVGSRPVDDLSQKIVGLVPEIHVVGDAKGPRKALDAIWEGYDVGRTI
ncbi:MAG: oxidoreductase [Thermodesulfobacteriota bacterium]